jgi:hypothetical protein
MAEKKQTKKNKIKIADLKPSKDVRGGVRASQASVQQVQSAHQVAGQSAQQFTQKSI